MKGKLKEIFSGVFWEEAWDEAGRLRREKTGIHNGLEEAAKWDRRAGYFEKRVSEDKGTGRIHSIMKFLRDENVIFPGMKIVDVGCGNGSITVELAAEAGEIYALDPSEKMLTYLMKKIKSTGLSNVTPVKGRWQEIDLKEKGWDEYFDLTFASMSPGVNNGHTLRKLIDASRKYCYFSTFAGRMDEARSELWELITDKPFITEDLDIIYPFNLLYAWGYRPSMRYHQHYRYEKMPPGKAVEELFQYIKTAAGAEDTARETVEKYVASKSDNGLFTYQMEIHHGMLIWDKTVMVPPKTQ